MVGPSSFSCAHLGIQKQKVKKPEASTTVDDNDIPSKCASKPHLNQSTTFSLKCR